MWLPMYMLSLYFLHTGVLSVQGQRDEQQPSIITTIINDYFGFMNDFNGFSCEASGTNLKFYWKHNDILVTENYPLKFPKLNTSRLQPRDDVIRSDYEGTYQCFAENSIGTVFGRKATVKFTVVGRFEDESGTVSTRSDVVVGRSYSIPCPAHADSNNVNYKWEYKEANQFVSLPPRKRIFVTKDGTLYFSTVKAEDITHIDEKGGIYCRQEATVGRKTEATPSSPIKLRATRTVSERSKPDIRTIIGTRSVFSGEGTVVLKCGAIGYPTPDLTWYKVNTLTSSRTEVKNGQGYKLDRFNQFLTIEDVDVGKAGDYVCKANNSEGSDEATGKIIVADRPQWAVGGALANIQPAIESKYVWECRALGGATYAWFKNGFEMTRGVVQESNYEIRDSPGKSQLIFNRLSADNNGMYQCTAANEKDTIYSTGRLKVKIKKPEFTERMGPITLIRTTQGVVACPVDAAPLPEIVWKKDGQRIAYDSRVKLADNNRDLLINNVSNADEGEYNCNAENRLGEVEGSSRVRVGEDITVLLAPVSNRNVTVRYRYELDCKAKGDPTYEVKYRWLRNGLPLEYSARIHWVKEDYKLLVLDSLVSDTGTYTCIAFAETPLYIEKRMEADIVVKAPVNPPDIIYVDGDCWRENANLVWKLGSFNNEEEIFFYLIQWSTTYLPEVWMNMSLIRQEDYVPPPRLDFTKLPPYSQISFRVIVRNRIGPSEPSKPTDPATCLTAASAPTRCPLYIYGKAHGNNTLSLVWKPLEQMYWGAPRFFYTLQWRRKTRDTSEGRWDSGRAFEAKIEDGNNNTIVVMKPGYYNEWEFRIKSSNDLGSPSCWRYNTSFSGQQAPNEKPEGLATERISARSADIIWQRVSPPLNGSIDGYKIQYWHSVIGLKVVYKKDRKRKKRAVGANKNKNYCFDPRDPCIQTTPERESQLLDLEPYKEYHVKIAAFNSGGDGPFSEELVFRTAEAEPGVPYAVNIYAYGRYAKLTWKQPRQSNGKILQYEVSGRGVVKILLPWWMRRHIIYDLEYNSTYEAQLRARTSTGWGKPVIRWFKTALPQRPAKPLLPEVVGYGEDGVNVTFMEPKPIILTKYAGPVIEKPWDYRPVGGHIMEHRGRGGYPEFFKVLYRKVGEKNFAETSMRQMFSERDQTWIVIENLEKYTLYEFATVPINTKEGNGPMSDLAYALPGGIVPKVKKLHWYQRDWFIALAVLFGAAFLLFLVILCSTSQLKRIYYEGAPKRRKDREREKIYEPEDVDGGFNEYTLKSARSSRSVITSRSGPPPPYSVTNGSTSRHSGDFDQDDLDSEEDDEKHEVSTYYSDEKKVPLDDLEDEEEEDSQLATFV